MESDTAVLHLKLRDTLYEELEFEEIGDYHVAYVDSHLHVPKQLGAAGGDPMDVGANKPVQTASAEEMKLALQTLPTGTTPQGHPAVMLSVGDIKLSQMKKILNKQGLAAEFHLGQLKCSGQITLRKQASDSNHIVIDGPLCDEYYKVRELLYSQFVIL
jgi:cleavage and polyadenylation specificity factor subunit 2